MKKVCNYKITKWQEFFLWIPIETIIRERQDDYYKVLNASNTDGESTIFVQFMLYFKMLRAVIPFCWHTLHLRRRPSILWLMKTDEIVLVSSLELYLCDMTGMA